MFCVSCGSFIAIGSRAKPTPESEPFSGPPPVPGDADVDVSLPLIEGVPPLGSYSLEAERRATRRTRTLTAVTSVVLAMVIGGAALYLASPLSQRDGGVPETAVVTSATDAPEPTEQTGAVSGITIEPEVVVAPEPETADLAAEPDAEPIAEPEPVAKPAAEPEPVIEAEPVVEPEPEPVVEPEPDPEPVAEPEPVADPEPIDDPSVVEPDEPAQSVRTVALPSAGDPAAYDGSWVCREEIVIEDSRLRDWSLGRASFRIRDDFERVVLQLERAGNGSGDPASITADSIGSWNVESNVPGADRPGLGRRSVTLKLDDGFSGSLSLRGYRPSGLDIIKEVSVYPAGRDGRNVVISADTDGCYRVRVVAWDDSSNSVRRAEIHVDIKP